MRVLNPLLILLLATSPVISLFAQYEAADDITISQPYDGDLYVAGGSVSVEQVPADATITFKLSIPAAPAA